MSLLVRLGDVAEVIPGRVPAKTIEHGSGMRFFGIAEVSGHTPRVVDPGIDLSKAAHLRPGDVVVVLLGDLGKSALVDNDDAGAVLGRECAALRARALDKLAPSWLYAWTQSEHFKLQVSKGGSGTTMPRISIRTLSDFELPLPPLPYQRELAEDISYYDSVLAATRELTRNLEDLRAAAGSLAVARAVKI